MSVLDVAAAVLIENDRILAARRRVGLKLAGFWEFPGGKVEQGEEPNACLARELNEEFGIEAKVERFFCESIHRTGQKAIRLLAFKTRRISGRYILRDHDEIRWLRTDQLKDIRWSPADVAIADKLIEEATLNYYEQNASLYCDKTMNQNIDSHRNYFSSLLPPGAHILDLGCGSGRDSAGFLAQGFQVTSMDPSPAIVAITSRFLGRQVHQQTAQDLSARCRYDGIWACASLLHIPKSEISHALKNVAEALLPEGKLYASFKEGRLERWDHLGRFYNDYTTDSLEDLFKGVPSLSVDSLKKSDSFSPDSEEKWLSIIATKTGV